MLHATGALAPVAWQLSPAVKGWSIVADPENDGQAVLQAPAPAAGDMALAVLAVDSRGVELRIEYRTRVRGACWLAYTANGPEGPQLALAEALLQGAQPTELQHNASVYDFRFSPDGRYLAYRYGADAAFPRGRHLALVELSTLHEQPLPFLEEAVTAYAWSPDSSVLAVGFLAGGAQRLSGVRLPSLSSGAGPIWLDPIPAFVEENLAWVGDDVVAFHAELLPDVENPGQFLPTNPDHLRTPFYARLQATAFVGPQFTQASFVPNVFLQPASDGFWTVNWDMMFFPMTGSATDAVQHYGATLLAPSGNYSALLEGEAVLLLSAQDGLNGVPASSKPGEGCPMPLAWSQQDTLACVADIDNDGGSGTHGEVRFFDAKAGSELLDMSSLLGFCKDDISAGGITSCTALRHGYGYGVNEATAMPRGFSPSGRWFAFTRAGGGGSYVYWADLEASPAALRGTASLQETPRRLAFSPDSRKLAFQLGGSLFVKELNGVRNERRVTDRLQAVDACTEEFPTAPHEYCGNTALDASFVWAPDSMAIAYRASGGVTVVDTSHADYFVNFPLSLPLCEAPLCSGELEFQPLTRN